VIPNPPTHSPGLLSSGEGLDVPQKVDKPQHKRIRTRKSLCQPPQTVKVRCRSQKQQTRNARFAPVPYRPRRCRICLCFGCYRFFLFPHVVVPLVVSTEPRGLGAGLDCSFRHMSHACSEPRARCSRQHWQSHLEGSSVAGPCRSSVLSSEEAFSGVCFTFWLGSSPLYCNSVRLFGCFSVRGLSVPRPFPSESGQSSVPTGQGLRSAD
jgi:hypothetical protein